MGGAIPIRALSLALSLSFGSCRTFDVPVEPDAGGADSEPVILPAVLLADTYLDQGHPSQNHGDLAWAVVGSGFDSGEAKELLVRFGYDALLDEQAGGSIAEARLRLYYNYHGDGNPAGRELTVHRVEQPWDEAEADWDNRPSFTSEPTSEAIVPANASTWIEWDVTADVNSDLQQAGGCHGWIVRDREAWGGGDAPQAYFDTREAGSYKPTLLIEL